MTTSSNFRNPSIEVISTFQDTGEQQEISLKYKIDLLHKTFKSGILP
jgi:hypothetical protein